MNILRDERNYRIGGRYTWQDSRLCLAFSASYIEFAMKGNSVIADIESDEFAEEETLKAWVAVFVNDEPSPRKRFPLKKGLHSYDIYQSDERREVSVRIMKYSENAFGMVAISKIDIGDGEILQLKETDKKLIEFIGDSITCGYGIEGIVEKDTFTTAQENPWEAYACLTARKLDADYELVSWSGNGIISHYVEENINEPRLDKPLMPQLYPYADLELESRLGKKSEYTVWAPERRPDIVVIHLGTNDCSFAREIPERNEMYYKEYMEFVKQLRKLHPKAAMICMLGVMDRRLNPTLEKAVEQIKREGDENVFYLDTPLQKDEDGIGADCHPSKITHEKVAKLLSSFINNLPQ